MRDPFQPKHMRSKRPPKGWAKARRVTAYQAPPPSRFRRFLRFFINPWLVTFTLLFVLIGFLGFTYFWFEFSDDIDRKLLGSEIYTASAGIYSAPKLLKTGERVTMMQLIDYLKSAGYIEKNAKADESRSRYSVVEGNLVIEPGVTGVLDGAKVFPAISVNFAKDGKSVSGIADLEKRKQVDSVKLEPKILSTVAAEGDGRRKTVTFQDLPNHLVKAITVTEDRAFFEHYGVNFRGIARALWRRYEKEDDDSPLANQGGSSITQQLVKNLLLTNEPTYERKAREAFMSVILETRLTKQEIFTLYANQIYLGQQQGVSIYGVGEASNVYFGKDVSQLSLPEAAFIAGIIRSPNRYGPYKNPERVEERRNQVIDSMAQAGEITAAQAQEARATKLTLKPITGRKDLQGMPYFSQFVIEELPKVTSDPEALQHYRVYTSIDPDLQRIAYETVAGRLEKLESKYFSKQPKGNLNGALVAIRPKTGEIVAMVGGRDYEQNQFNRATDAMRQPGSVFKPFVYATALNSAYDTASRVFTAATVLKDEKKVFASGREEYAPNNYGDSFTNKETTLRDALVKSKNTITVDIGMQVNIGKVMNMAAKAGMPKVERAYPSMALGTAEATPLSVAAAYTTFANLGDRVLPMPITQVTEGDGSTVVAPKADRKNVVRSDVAYIMNDIMKDVINRGTAAQVQAWGFKNVAGKTGFAGKTGTSRDGWFVGYTPELVCVVYVGFDDNDDLGMKGSDSAMPIWADFMKEALALHPEWNGDWSMPAGVRRAEIDIRNGSLIRELDVLEEVETKATPTPVPTPAVEGLDDPAWATENAPETREVETSNVPAEFRRVELFIAGTMPSRALFEEQPTVYDEYGNPVEPEVPPSEEAPSPTPLVQTWENLEDRSSGNSSRRAPGNERGTSVLVCPITGMRVTAKCPGSEARTFKPGSEPKDFCTFHR
jgi:penicillin-binding protein 1B